MIFSNIKRYIKAIHNAKKYTNIIPLGYNCEIAYRFFRQYKFVDSSLFGWSFVDLKQLKNSLLNFDKLGTGEFIYDIQSHTIQCQNTGIFFHGRTPAEKFSDDENINNKIIQNDIIELKSRIDYLKQKFVKYANNGLNTLYVIKISELDANSEYFKDEISWLYDYLSDFCKNEFKLLVVAEKSFYEKCLFENPNIITRYVEKYSPDSAVTLKKSGDAFGWRLIFTEFQPAIRKKQKGKLKFEAD